jgi:predicted permease
MSSIYPLLGIYLFIVVGFIAKKSFKDRIDEKSLVFLSIYFLQPFLVLWGFTTNQLDFKIIEVPIIFTLIISIFLFLAILVANTIFKDKQDRSIFIVTSIIANTGNLGIPLGLMLFGKESIIYTTLINIANIFLVYIVGVFFYSRGRYSVKESLLNIVKLPIIWFTTLAIVLNLVGFQYPKELLKPLEMGAYASMVLQLVIFGIYLNSVQISSIDLKMLVSSILFRFILVPTLSILILTLLLIDGLVYKVLLLELIVPIAVNNVNLAALYSCKPKKVAFLTFVSSMIFLFYFIWFAKGQLL